VPPLNRMMNSLNHGTGESGGRPKVTIAIPTFNRAGWIEGAVAGALAQTYPDFEVLVSDNASTDDTSAVLAKFADPRVRVVRHETNIGMVGNWNACLKEARGDYLALVPDDDRISPWFLERCMRLVDDEPGLPIVLGLSDLRLASEGERVLRAAPNKRFASGIWDGIDILNEFLEDRISAQMCSILVYTQALRDLGGFPQGMPFSLDKAGWAPVLLTGRAGFVNESCGTFNEHETNHTNGLDVNLCLDDEWRFTELMMAATRGKVRDQKRRRSVIRSAKRYFGRRALEILVTYRKSGASLAAILPLVWRWKASLVHLRIGSSVRLARLLSVLLLPKTITNQIRRLKRHYNQDLSWKT
jgi:glycosyltransferase involved in cell wall biosynthesis